MSTGRPAPLYRSASRAGRVTAWATIALIALLPLSWMLPLLETKAFWVFGSDITIWHGAVTLMGEDPFLALVVIIFAMILPMAKLALYALFWFAPWRPGPVLRKLGHVLSKLSMTDVFLFALIILAAKGLSIGEVSVRFGLYLFSGVVLASLWVSVVTEHALSNRSD